MSVRERQNSGGATLAERPAASSSRAEPIAAPSDREYLAWDEFYRALTPGQQQELLALASRQGLVHAHQLPAVDPTVLQQRRQLFTQLLSGKFSDLSPAHASPVTVNDVELDTGQREAVARAMATPDICLIQGQAGTGKSRTAAEIVVQAARRGERVLLLTATPAGLDRILGHIGRVDGICALRCLHPGESVETLPECVRPFTFAERARDLSEGAVQAARSQAAAAEHAVARFHEEEVRWQRLAAIAENLAAVESRAAKLSGQQSHLAEEVDHAWAALPEYHDCECRRQQAQERCEAQCEKLAQQQEKLEQDRKPLREEHDALRPLVEAKRHGRWWTLSWWRALFRDNVLARDAQLTERLHALDKSKQELEAQGQQATAQAQESERTYQQRRADVLSSERARRAGLLEQERLDLEREQAGLRASWEENSRGLETTCSPTCESVGAARQEWQARVTRERTQADFARCWAEILAEAAPTLPGRLLAWANVTVATPAGLAADPHFSENNGRTVPFDLLVCDETDLFNDTELQQAARRGRRWVLLGEPEPKPVLAKSGRPIAARQAPFTRLWQLLHCSPRQLPFRWLVSGDRLVCRLRTVPDDQRQWAEVEPVADNPAIELVIFAPPRQDPALVEVRFPRDFPLARAKEFLLHELQEIAAQGLGPALAWEETPAGLRLDFSSDPAAWQRAGLERLPVADGVIEVFRAVPRPSDFVCETLGLEFATGWSRQQAEAWLTARLGPHDHHRTAYLGRSHRCAEPLSSVVAEVVHQQACDGARTAVDDSVIRLIAVPSHETGKRPKFVPRGAGHEVDLHTPASAAGLPGELKGILPRRGFVNLTEAQAVVHELESLVANPAFVTRAAEWQRSKLPASCTPHAQGCLQGNRLLTSHAPVVVVSALYEAQVHLLRHTISHSASLKRLGLVPLPDGHFRIAEGLELLVDTPARLRQRECQVLLLSLTRSHCHRAVAFSEQANGLPLALTRACDRVLVFADVGTLVRRVQWHGAVDHLDEAAAEREREMLHALLTRLTNLDLTSSPAPAVAAPLRR